MLHLDKEANYGGALASFSFKGLLGWLQGETATDVGPNVPESPATGVEDAAFVGGCHRVNVGGDGTSCFASKKLYEFYPCAADDAERDGIKSSLLTESHQFNIDLVPRFLRSRGKLVDILVQCGISRYLEFKGTFVCI